jgi:basic membrane protein A
MKKSVLATLLTLTLIIVSVAPVFAQDAAIDSVCLITDVGRVNDGTFNQFAYEGMLRAVDDFGLESTFIETTAQTDYATNINTCVDEGFDAVVTVGFLLTDATLEAAAANPEVYFIGVDQFILDGPANMVGLQFREDQMGYAMGVLAALSTESGVIGGVFGEEIPPVVKFRNGYVNGAVATNPDIVILDVYIDSFIAPERGAAAAEQFIGEGADVIFGGGGVTGSGGIRYAAEQGVQVIGVDQDEYFTTFGGGETPGAENIISSALKRVDNAVYNNIGFLVEGDLASFNGGGLYVGDVTNGGVGAAGPNDADVPQEVQDAVAATFDAILAGEIVTGVDPVTGALLEPIPTVAAEAGGFETLLAAADAAGLVETLTDGGPFTVFAPTDEAFAAALEDLGLTAEELLADTDTLTSILLYHVVPVAPSSSVVVTLDSVTTVQGDDVTIEATDMGVVLNGSVNVVATDIPAANGIIHVIDGVLLPPM